MTERPGASVDHERTACLCGDGLPGFWAAVCVTATGDDVLWLVSVDELDAEHPRHGDANQPHEQLGPLPAVWRRRLRIAPNGEHLCAAFNKKGLPCGNTVLRAGERCLVHRGKPDANSADETGRGAAP